MRIGIIGALAEEINLLKEDMNVTNEIKLAQRSYYVGNLYGHEVVLSYSRAGKVAAAIAATTMITAFNVDCVLFTGVAGAVAQSLDIGDVVIGSDLVQHDVDVRPMFQPQEIPFLGVESFKVDDRLQENLFIAAINFVNDSLSSPEGLALLSEYQIATPKTYLGKVASGDQFIFDKGRANHIKRNNKGLLCIEMEGAAIAQVCYEHSKPFAVFRVISDKVGEQSDMSMSEFIRDIVSYYAQGIVRNFLQSLKSTSQTRVKENTRVTS